MCHLGYGSSCWACATQWCSCSGGTKWVEFCVVFAFCSSELSICGNWKPFSVDKFFELAHSDVQGFIAVMRNNAKRMHRWELLFHFLKDYCLFLYWTQEYNTDPEHVKGSVRSYHLAWSWGKYLSYLHYQENNYWCFCWGKGGPQLVF